MTEFESNFGSALEAAAAIKAGKISSVELTRHVFERIDKFQPKLNAFVYQMREEALASARRADKAVARKDKRLPFAGVPVVVKESFGVAGRPCTWGVPALKNTRASANSTAVQRLLDAGAVLIGATNVPFQLGDFQSYNELYGTTNNPWDVGRTPGGSFGFCPESPQYHHRPRHHAGRRYGLHGDGVRAGQDAGRVDPNKHTAHGRRRASPDDRDIAREGCSYAPTCNRGFASTSPTSGTAA